MEKASTVSKSTGGPIPLIISLAVVTALAGGAGFVFSKQFLMQKDAATAAVKEAEEKKATGHEGQHGSDSNTTGALKPELVVLPLAPILTNLAKPKGLFVRLEGSLLIEKDTADATVLAAKVGEDIVILLRSLELSEIQGINGLSHLRDDINDRVRIRSEGKAREVIISSLVIE